MDLLSVIIICALCRLSSAVLVRETSAGVRPDRHYDPCPLLDGIYTSVMRRIFNPGLHKELSTEIEIMLTTSVLPDKCQLVVEETVPRGMYVDPDQLRDMMEYSGLRSHIPVKVDIEKPEFDSDSFRLYLFRDLRVQENLRVTNIELPIHLRYHRPALPKDAKEHSSSTSPVAVVRMQNPRLLLSCQGDDIPAQCPDRVSTAYCDSSGTTKCEYLNIPYKVNVPAVEVAVPVGNLESTYMVVGITSFVIGGGTIYLLVALFRPVDVKLHLS